ncbi:hypothetical protein C8K18_101259 [Paraburkholderia sp. GV068]|uniref:hypothetical protein n=1 Tax=unclassified Paraburkholderia TaxID=2615204 RepID=UPI000D4C8A27|nr:MULTISPECIES: hypothetical protein [unclassified Paraburkholderia]PTR03793.1 hypothetical protein C8K19_101183 [Paraburkholderia sp. GV072]PUB08751.1 hypothetical protein C8K18_101259 [Paraburkholderia sp. GV068]
MSFVVQRFHPGVRPGLNLTSARSRFAVHSQQSYWDSSCTLHCLAMALQIYGRIADTSRIATYRRRLEATFWKRAIHYFFTGATFEELATLIAELECGLRTKVAEKSSHREVIAFTERELTRKRLVICSYHAAGEAHIHAVLAIGVEGGQFTKQLEAHTLLVLDPAEGPPTAMACCNGRLQYADGKTGRRLRHAIYTTPNATFSVVLDSAISIKIDEPRKPP